MNTLTVTRRAVLLLAGLLCTQAAQLHAREVPGTPLLRVCADPGNMPLSNDRHEGFQNEIASVIAEAMGTQVSYFYRPYLNRGLTRQTFDNNECDILMDMSPDDGRMLHTMPVYKSTFVLAYRSDRGLDIRSLDDRRLLDGLKVGVFQHSAIRTVLQRRGMRRENTVVQTIAHDADLQPHRQPHMQVQKVLDGELDVAAVWGPLAGWYRTMKQAPLAIVPVNHMEDEIPLEFALTIGLHKNAHDLKAKVEQALLDNRDRIRQILTDYGVPLVACAECVVSGDIPSHGPYRKSARKSATAIPPAQSDPATLPARIDAALQAGSTLEQELFNATLSRDGVRVEYLLQRGADVNARDAQGMTPLMVAAREGDPGLINGLLHHGANPDLQDNDGWTAVMHAVRGNDPQIQRLLGRHRPNYALVNHEGVTALGLAVYENRQNAVVAMLDMGARPDDVMSDAKVTALMIAVEAGNLTLAQTLLQYGANPNLRRTGGVTPLMMAAVRGDAMMVSLLIKSGADVHLTDDEGKTARMLAVARNAHEAAEMLEQVGG